MSNQGFKKILISLGIATFAIPSLIGSIGAIMGLFNPPPEQQKTIQSQDTQLKEQEKGLLLVLEREPNNINSLKELVGIRLQLGDGSGTVEILERLVKLEPKNTQYQELLTAIKKQLANPSPNSSKNSNKKP